MFSRVFIIGTGLLGGSIGLALRSGNLAQAVIGIDRDQKNLEKAIERGAIDHGFVEIRAAFSIGVEKTGGGLPGLLIVCTPVGTIVEQVRSAAEAAPFPLLITDVGSTKSRISASLCDLPNGCRFLGSHPIAGSEKSGAEFSAPDLFKGKTTVLTPKAGPCCEDLLILERFWNALGSHVLKMEPSAHDRILAQSSHLPHLISSVLMNSTDEECFPFIGTGFLGMTRLAAGDASLWCDIICDNRENILNSIDSFEKQLAAVREKLLEKDNPAIRQFLEKSRNNRKTLERE